MGESMNNEEQQHQLFVLREKITKLEVRDGINERVTQSRAIINYILADAVTGEPSVNGEDVFGAVWALERLTQEIEILLRHI